MVNASTLLLKLVILLIGFLVLSLCTIVLPIGITTDATGFYRPLLIGLYIPAIPFFYALNKAFKLLILIDKNLVFSGPAIQALTKIKDCALIISAMFTIGMPYIFSVADRDDAPGVAAMGLVIIFASIVIATFAAVLQKLLQNAVDLKSENDFTI